MWKIIIVCSDSGLLSSPFQWCGSNVGLLYCTVMTLIWYKSHTHTNPWRGGGGDIYSTVHRARTLSPRQDRSTLFCLFQFWRCSVGAETILELNFIFTSSDVPPTPAPPFLSSWSRKRNQKLEMNASRDVKWKLQFHWTVKNRCVVKSEITVTPPPSHTQRI